VKWIDAEDIGIALTERFPDLDPLSVRFTDLPMSPPKVLAAAGARVIFLFFFGEPVGF